MQDTGFTTADALCAGDGHSQESLCGIRFFHWRSGTYVELLCRFEQFKQFCERQNVKNLTTEQSHKSIMTV